jgi:hypothetical protein
MCAICKMKVALIGGCLGSGFVGVGVGVNGLI